ncbi:hypothetical protein K0C01_11785 [Salinarchaeum sp. IM2453]|uniref:hypothetical protein n=1 Tax=Salinarchaeum sp. IM2453 TaxID=2862870 RepID=UPI001C83B537|nr:hypothetical protein [Salinarchaeum sp. IM2453]QZA88447.1 hypothetical protein K0C01_11785 [Salinarchaeum sp. IM2453]
MKNRIIKTLRQPEYTGENRCEPCTIANIGIAAVVSGVIARRSKPAALVAFAGSVVLIYLRGYLIPKTPELTKQYLPAPILRLFGKDPYPDMQSGIQTTPTQPQEENTEGQSTPSREGDEGEQILVKEMDKETYFREIGVIEECEDINDLCLTEEFNTEWINKMEATDADTITSADIINTMGIDDEPVGEFELISDGDAYRLQREERIIGQWPSAAAMLADVTGAQVLDDWHPSWTRIDAAQKGELLNGLRLFLETCPTTGGNIVAGEEVVESCCHSYEVIAISCEETGERIFEHPVSGIDK